MNKPGHDENFFDSEQEATKAKIAKTRELQRMRLLDDVKWVLSTAKGRRFIWWFWGLCGTFSESYVSKDTTQTAYNEGKRNIGLQILLLVNEANSEAFAQMQKDSLAEAGNQKKKGDLNE